MCSIPMRSRASLAFCQKSMSGFSRICCSSCKKPHCSSYKASACFRAATVSPNIRSASVANRVNRGMHQCTFWTEITSCRSCANILVYRLVTVVHRHSKMLSRLLNALLTHFRRWANSSAIFFRTALKAVWLPQGSVIHLLQEYAIGLLARCAIVQGVLK